MYVYKYWCVCVCKDTSISKCLQIWWQASSRIVFYTTISISFYHRTTVESAVLFLSGNQLMICFTLAGNLWCFSHYKNTWVFPYESHDGQSIHAQDSSHQNCRDKNKLNAHAICFSAFTIIIGLYIIFNNTLKLFSKL